MSMTFNPVSALVIKAKRIPKQKKMKINFGKSNFLWKNREELFQNAATLEWEHEISLN